MAAFVLVHGAWHDPRVWARVAPALRGAGHTVETPDLPGNGRDGRPAAAISLEVYTDAIAAVVSAQTAPVVLVGHSMAGIVISTLAERLPERIAKLVYLAAFLLPDGVSILSFYERYATPDMQGARQALRLSADKTSSSIEPADARRLFFNTCSEADAKAASMHLTPQPAQPRRDTVRITPGKWGRVPRVYFATLRDQTVFPALQQLMYGELLPTRAVAFDTDHSPFFSAPERLVAALMTEA